MEVLFETYFSQHAEELLSEKKITKATFAKEMAVKPQNVKKLFSTNNVQLLSKVSDVLGIPIDFLINGEKKGGAIDGFVEIGNETYRIKSKEDILNLAKLINEE